MLIFEPHFHIDLYPVENNKQKSTKIIFITLEHDFIVFIVYKLKVLVFFGGEDGGGVCKLCDAKKSLTPKKKRCHHFFKFKLD